MLTLANGVHVTPLEYKVLKAWNERYYEEKGTTSLNFVLHSPSKFKKVAGKTVTTKIRHGRVLVMKNKFFQ